MLHFEYMFSYSRAIRQKIALYLVQFPNETHLIKIDRNRTWPECEHDHPNTIAHFNWNEYFAFDVVNSSSTSLSVDLSTVLFGWNVCPFQSAHIFWTTVPDLDVSAIWIKYSLSLPLDEESVLKDTLIFAETKNAVSFFQYAIYEPAKAMSLEEIASLGSAVIRHWFLI